MASWRCKEKERERERERENARPVMVTCAPVNGLVVTYSLLVRAASRVAYGPSSKMCSFKRICRLRWFFVCACLVRGVEMSGA